MINRRFLIKKNYENFFSMVAAFERDTRHIRSAIESVEDVKRESEKEQ